MIYAAADYAATDYVTTEAKQLFNEGITAARSGDYPVALKAFEMAKAAGLDSAALNYNLGVSYYRLQRYQEAESYFTLLLAHPALAATAAYNLGLIAVQLKLPFVALKWFKRAVLSAAPAEISLRSISEQAVQELENPALTPAAKVPLSMRASSPWSGMLSTGIGVNNNINLTPDSIGNQELLAPRQTDSFLEVGFSAANYWVGNRSHGWRIHSAGFADNYAGRSDADYTDVGIGISYDQLRWGWYHRLDVQQNQIKFGEYHDRQTSFAAETQRSLSPLARLDFRYRITDVDSVEQNAYWQGTQQQLRSRLRLRGEETEVYLLYTFEINDKRDFKDQNSAAFTSYSPLRQTVGFSADVPLDARRQLSCAVNYRVSQFRDHNIEVEVGNPNVISRSYRRQDQRTRVELSYEYRLFKQFYIATEIQRTNNDSNRAISDYQQTIYSVASRWSF